MPTSNPQTPVPHDDLRHDDLAEIDRKMIHLLSQRADMVAARENAVCPTGVADAQQAMTKFLDGVQIESVLPRQAVEDIMRHVVSRCHDSIRQTRVAYLGPLYSYSHLAAVNYFGDAPGLIPVSTIAAVFEAIIRKDCVAGVVPVENSTDGRVVDTLGMFLKHRVRVCGELLLPIHHNLLSRTPRAEITEVYSKPQALSQCRQWLADNLPAARLIEMSSTAAAAQLAAEKPGAAAVASLQAGQQYGLTVVAHSIQDNKNNVTRFAILGSEPTERTGNDKTALLFQVDHQPGALADAMTLFKTAGLNLTWIESFPLPGSRNEYLFFVELEGHETDEAVRQAIDALSDRAQRLEILGSYPKHHLPAIEH
jgi:chorismate mutase / prephenate dehydratase